MKATKKASTQKETSPAKDSDSNDVDMSEDENMLRLD
jgi:hypothetical protein